MLEENGFISNGKTAGGCDKWYHLDGIQIQICPNGEVTRRGRRVQNPGPNARGRNHRLNPDGSRLGDGNHNTGEVIRR